ncbi:hypothetical protein Mgra_00000216 [Meloidogyne graminicola]|uniref:Uncharacterized protein n=1 Tax=Meloidogyne graminicola TaxID=189291 RepID=A0A8T0A511_9BILA|nr:hypothetical protein Mgra_00000216 [Meloidogyne graminicola]
MGVCSSTKKRLIVRQTSSLKLSPIHKENPLLNNKNNLTSKFIESKLEKKDSDLNLLPTDLQKNMAIISDESIFEREKRMVVILVSCNIDNPSQLVLINVDLASSNFGKIICRLSLPLPGEELYSLACVKNTHSLLHSETEDLQQQNNQQFTLIVPVPSHSRIYVLKLMDSTLTNGSENGSLKKQQQQTNSDNSAITTNIRIQKCITREELSRWDLGAPLSVCSNNALRSNALPLLLVTAVDRYGHCKGDLLRLDRRTFCPIDRRKRSITSDDRESSINSGYSTFSNSAGISLESNTTTITTNSFGTNSSGQQNFKFPMFGGTLAINLRNGVVFSTEWGNLDQIFKQKPSLNPNLGSQNLNGNNEEQNTIYGCGINVWEMRRRKLIQTIRLNPAEGGLWPVCIRMLHHSELTHGFVCTSIGSSIFHLHKCTRTGQFKADKIVSFSSVIIGPTNWPGNCPEVPAFLTDMVISMDDLNLYVCSAFHGFIAQLDISDPFRPSLTQKVFLGGIIYRCLGISELGKMPINKSTSIQRSYNTEQIKLAGKIFEGGPCRLQLSLDGRRLFISNSFLRNWDQHFFPKLAESGSSIALVHIDPSGVKPMKVDKDFGIHFDTNETKNNGNINLNGNKLFGFYARDMRFLGEN